jgi:hypothetical protein
MICADIVDRAAAAMLQLGHLDDDHEHREQRERQVQIEDEPPALDDVAEGMHRRVVGEEAADHRPDDAGQAEGGPEQAGELAPLARLEQVGDNGEGGGEERAAADALDGAEDDQLGHAAADQRQRPELTGEARQPGPNQEDADAGEQHRLAPMQVGELAPDRHHHRRGEQIAGGDPGVEVQALQLRHDARHGGGDDGLVQRAEQEDDHQRRQGQAALFGGEGLDLMRGGQKYRVPWAGV